MSFAVAASQSQVVRADDCSGETRARKINAGNNADGNADAVRIAAAVFAAVLCDMLISSLASLSKQLVW